MAVIGPNRLPTRLGNRFLTVAARLDSSKVWVVLTVAALFAVAAGLGAETPRAQVSYVASALTAGNAADAMAPFDRSFAEYEKLRGYFSGLTGAFQLTNQLEVTEEQDSRDEATLTLEWTLTLTDAQTGYMINRNATVHARLMPQGGTWKIVEFSPIELFDPQPKR
jgi:hypothetical protein